MSLILNHTNNQLLSPVLLFSFTLILGLIIYLLESFALFKMAKVKNIKYPWLAFVPIGGTYTFGKVAFKENYKTILLIGLYLFSEIFSIGTQIANTTSILNGSPQFHSNINIFLLAYMIFSFYAAYKIYKQFSDKATIMLVFSVLSCGFLAPIFLFAIRNNPIKTLDN